jgi:hypothetical protein
MMFLTIWIVCAVVTAIIASSKGRSGLGWFLIGAVLGIFGIVLIACLPALPGYGGDPATTLRNVAIGTSNKQAPAMRAMKLCPDCAEEVKADARVCRFCRHEFEPITASMAGRG